jgi:hypothetical protein
MKFTASALLLVAAIRSVAAAGRGPRGARANDIDKDCRALMTENGNGSEEDVSTTTTIHYCHRLLSCILVTQHLVV